MINDPAAYLAAIVASSNDAIIGMDLAGRITAWNDTAEALYGYLAGEMIGQSINRLVPEGRVIEELDLLARLARGEQITHLVTERITADGRTIPISLTVSPMRDAAGEIVGVSKTARDLTDGQRREALLTSVPETVPDALLVTDATGIIQSFSPAASRVFAYAPEDVIGGTSPFSCRRPMRPRMMASSRAITGAATSGSLASGVSWRLSARMVRCSRSNCRWARCGSPARISSPVSSATCPSGSSASDGLRNSRLNSFMSHA